MPQQSPSQTIGPFFKQSLIDAPGEQNELINSDTLGEMILICGRVLDGDGVGIDDAMVEIWQADGNGVYAHPADPNHEQADPSFKGFGRAQTINGGGFTFKTVKPGAVGEEGAPHVNVRVFARGMLVHATSRIYFGDEENGDDPILGLVPEVRRPTLVATLEEGRGLPTYRFDLVMQGEDETVFFDV